jgi:hypothetical protein
MGITAAVTKDNHLKTINQEKTGGERNTDLCHEGTRTARAKDAT